MIGFPWLVFMDIWFMILGLSFRNFSLTWSCKDIHLYFFSNSFKALFFLFRSLFYLVVCRIWGTDVNFCPLSEKPFLSISWSLECQRHWPIDNFWPIDNPWYEYSIYTHRVLWFFLPYHWFFTVSWLSGYLALESLLLRGHKFVCILNKLTLDILESIV